MERDVDKYKEVFDGERFEGHDDFCDKAGTPEDDENPPFNNIVLPYYPDVPPFEEAAAPLPPFFGDGIIGEAVPFLDDPPMFGDAFPPFLDLEAGVDPFMEGLDAIIGELHDIVVGHE